MRTYEIVETIRYTVEAESAEEAEIILMETEDRYNALDGELEDRTIYPEE